MASVLYYCGKMLLIIFCSLVPATLMRLLWLAIRRRTETQIIRPAHEILFTMLIAFFLGLAALTVVPAMEQTESGLQFILDGGGRNFRLGRVFRDTYYISYLWGNHSYFWINIVGNIGIFMPVGLLLPLLWKSLRRWWRCAGIGFLLSFVIECSQLFIGRGSDVDDLWLNVLGAISGYGLYCLLTRIFPSLRTYFLAKKD